MEERVALDALSALAQESRLHVFRLLVRAGSAGLPAGEIASALDIPAATLSFHLEKLSRGGLVVASRRGRSLVYSLRVDGVRELLSFLTEDCCAGRPELCSLPGAGLDVASTSCCDTVSAPPAPEHEKNPTDADS